MMLTAGLYFPMTTAIWGAIYGFARIWFQIGYIIFGPKGRLPAAPVIMFTQTFFPVFSIVSLVMLAGHPNTLVAQN